MRTCQIILLLTLWLLSACTFPIQVQVAPSAVAKALAIGTTPTADPNARPDPQVTGDPGPALPVVGSTPVSSLTSTPAPAGPPNRIVAPAIHLDAPVVESGQAINPGTGQAEWQIADDAASYYSGSALPGRPGNTVILGHHNIKGKVFARLWELAPGDEVDLYVKNEIYRYRVSDTMIVPERDVPEQQRLQNAQWVASTTDERLTLITCWPANDNSHRVIVVALPNQEDLPAQAAAGTPEP